MIDDHLEDQLRQGLNMTTRHFKRTKLTFAVFLGLVGISGWAAAASQVLPKPLPKPDAVRKHIKKLLQTDDETYEPVETATLWCQKWDGKAGGALSCNPDDIYDGGVYAFDDFKVDGAWEITRVRIEGTDEGDAHLNKRVALRIQESPSYDNPGRIDLEISGKEREENLEFEFTSTPLRLTAGTYWISAWVDRNFLNSKGGSWYWRRTTASHFGSQHILHNPSGKFGLGSEPVLGSAVYTTPADLSFCIEGRKVADQAAPGDSPSEDP